ncbi:glycosyltransferase [Pseudonocardia broussonetiae]|uniref:Glycosyltransferase n=1 Tax=Pseudonocardia broussonetiae TaxID=2736640 RepID=A0A6M6JNU4_9PSEU|nr:glycosyltransferase [Pseudonocardia broussonetiae]QJY49045.1 glycosyltransferase [Pseudonocardia broussonetiae]
MGGARWLTAATVGVGLLNYLYSLGLTRALDVEDFAVFAAGQALLLTAGSVANTSVPWVLAQALAGAETPLERRRAVTFALAMNTTLAVGGGGVLFVIASAFAPPGPALVVAAAGGLVFLSSTTSGFLQGGQRFALLGVVRTGDAVLKIVAGLILVLAGLGATGALGGFAIGSLLVIVTGAFLMGSDLRPAAGALRLGRLWRSAAGVAGVQVLVSALATADLVLVAVLADDAGAASYQAAMILSRVPLFLAGAVAVAVFPMLARDETGGAALVRTALRLYLALVLPYTVALLAMPGELVGLLFPPEYRALAALLPVTAVGGLLIGAVNLTTTAFQAQRRFASAVRAQLAGLAVYVGALLLGNLWGGVLGLAVGAAVGAAATLVLLVVSGSAVWPRAFRPPAAVLLGCALLLVALLLLREHLLLWLVVAGTVGGLNALRVLGRMPRGSQALADRAAEGSAPVDERPRLRILHLGFEDWRKPGSGGGAVRTREVNARLARRHDVTVLVSRYRGARARVEDGVRYVPVGLALGYWGGILSYFAALPFAARRRAADVVVEDFAAPIGSVLPAIWCRRPLVAVVQWLDAEGKSRQYHLPFHRVQAAGVRRHGRFVAMSEDLAERLREGNPSARVEVIPNGVPVEAFSVDVPRGDDVVFLGRLEIAQKGLDMLVEALGPVVDRLPGRIVLAGDGPDRRAVERLVDRAGIGHRVVFAGRVDGADKLRLLAGARLVVMPSRYETFGIVAAEALACGTPVVAFEIPSLREVVVPGAGVLVEAFDVTAFGEAVVGLAGDTGRIARAGAIGREHARRYDWDEVAERQEAVYVAAAGRPAVAAPPERP